MRSEGLDDLLMLAFSPPKEYRVLLAGKMDRTNGLPNNVVNVSYTDRREVLA